MPTKTGKSKNLPELKIHPKDVELKLLTTSRNASNILGPQCSNQTALQKTHDARVYVMQAEHEGVVSVTVRRSQLGDILDNLLSKLEGYPTCKSVWCDGKQYEIRVLLAIQHCYHLTTDDRRNDMNYLTNMSGADLHLYAGRCPRSDQRVMKITGTRDAVKDCVIKLMELVRDMGSHPEMKCYNPVNFDGYRYNSYGGYSKKDEAYHELYYCRRCTGEAGIWHENTALTRLEPEGRNNGANHTEASSQEQRGWSNRQQMKNSRKMDRNSKLYDQELSKKQLDNIFYHLANNQQSLQQSMTSCLQQQAGEHVQSHGLQQHPNNQTHDQTQEHMVPTLGVQQMPTAPPVGQQITPCKSWSNVHQLVDLNNPLSPASIQLPQSLAGLQQLQQLAGVPQQMLTYIPFCATTAEGTPPHASAHVPSEEQHADHNGMYPHIAQQMNHYQQHLNNHQTQNISFSSPPPQNQMPSSSQDPVTSCYSNTTQTHMTPTTPNQTITRHHPTPRPLAHAARPSAINFASPTAPSLKSWTRPMWTQNKVRPKHQHNNLNAAQNQVLENE